MLGAGDVPVYSGSLTQSGYGIGGVLLKGLAKGVKSMLVGVAKRHGKSILKGVAKGVGKVVKRRGATQGKKFIRSVMNRKTKRRRRKDGSIAAGERVGTRRVTKYRHSSRKTRQLNQVGGFGIMPSIAKWTTKALSDPEVVNVLKSLTSTM